MSKVPQVKASARAIGIALFNTVLPYREQIGNRMFRDLVMYRVEDEIQTTSAATVYNFAKQKAVADGLTPDFGRAAGEKIGTKAELEQELEDEIREKMDVAVETAHNEAQAEADRKAQELADAKAAKEEARKKAQEEREAKRKEREEKAAADKEERAKKRAEAKEQREKEREEMKAKKDADKEAKKAAAEKAKDENPENKWQVENKETGDVVSYHPTRKAASEAKKESDNAAELKVVKIPA